MVSATQSLTPDPVHGDPASPQTWNRYPYVINDPMTKIDPFGGSHQDYDPYFVGCFPDPFFESLFGGFGCGCGYAAENPCPPGYEAIYGDRRPGGGPAIESINSLHNYANAVLPWGSGYGTNYTFTNTPNGVDFTISDAWINSLLGAGTIGEAIRGTLTILKEIEMLGYLIRGLDLINELQQSRGDEEDWTDADCEKAAKALYCGGPLC